MSREFDIIIFGATGYTGFFVIRELILTLQDGNPSNFKWAVAGRNEKKLIETLIKVSKELDVNLSDIKLIIADTNDTNSLQQMASRTRLIMNVVGPYNFHGQPVVEACMNQSTHHVDISGEPQYIEQMQLTYHHQAVSKNTLIVSTCGWDSIPCDMGVDYLKNKFQGRLHSVEAFMQNQTGPKGYKVNFGTLHSAIYGYVYANKLSQLRRQLYSEVLTAKPPKSRITLPRKHIPFHNPHVRGWCLEFPGLIAQSYSVQYYNYEHFEETPVQIQTYFVVGNLLQLIGVILFGIVFIVLSSFSIGRSMLESFPEVFTFGMFSKDGPTREQVDTAGFKETLVGRGWSQKTDTEPNTDPDKEMVVTVSGRDPGYIATSTCLVQAGITILLEEERMPRGVLTPASAFRGTKLRERLEARDLKFEVTKEIHLK